MVRFLCHCLYARLTCFYGCLCFILREIFTRYELIFPPFDTLTILGYVALFNHKPVRKHLYTRLKFATNIRIVQLL